MEKNNYKFTRVQKLTIIWYSIFTFVCLLNTFALFYKGSDYAFFVIFLPFIHFATVVIVYMVYAIYWWLKIDNKDPDSQYIKNKYPDIWERMHPLGDRSSNNFAAFAFSRGKYDDNSDKNLNRIKTHYRISQ